MTTRIKYIRYESMLISKTLLTYEGKRIFVQIDSDKLYIAQGLNILEEISHNNINKAKRIARDLLINKYNVRLINESRS